MYGVRFNQEVRGPKYEFSNTGSLVFVTGAPMSGKSTVSPLISSAIENCSSQNMDVFRLLMGREDEGLPAEQRNPVLQYGSCDSYLAVGSGEYSEESLIEGFCRNSAAICAPLEYVIPKLEVQGAQNMLFEGVQLLPSIVSRYMRSNPNSRYLVITSSGDAYDERRDAMFRGADYEFGRKYTRERLQAIEGHIIEESGQLPEGTVYVLDNSEASAAEVASLALDFLCESGLIIPK